MSAKTLGEQFPLHWLVWDNNFGELDKELAKDIHNKELKDPRGRTPLHLSVCLGHVESTKTLLRYGANANAENKGYWSVLHEAVSTGDPELVQIVLKHRDYQRYSKRTVGVPELLQKLKESPDFYVEMKWEFTSWVPLVSRMCPSDTYRVYKSGFSASNVELVTKTRTEHLSQEDKLKCRKNSSKSPLESFLGVAEEHNKKQGASNGDLTSLSYNPTSITKEEYFSQVIDLGDRDVGRPLDQTTKTQKFKATLWLCENYPLSLQQQVVPIIDLMSASNAHFKKLRDFITLQLPAGFPVKIEIPLFHVLNARITFGNINALDQSVDGVTVIEDEGTCVVQETCFDSPRGYSRLGDGHHERLRDEDDELLQFAIQQSLMDGGSSTENDQLTFMEALNNIRPPPTPVSGTRDEEERLLQRAIADSLAMSQGKNGLPTTTQPELISVSDISSDVDEELRVALEISRQQIKMTQIVGNKKRNN
ncbi:ANKRD13 [Mytilus edulis]|uniref:ANKRD13 n=1 Tax=Mytilus edulis TaxID=6550 RepID=A0A8S3T0I0_MYTED|nr:ANKRD13 [Mytilus edulis]